MPEGISEAPLHMRPPRDFMVCRILYVCCSGLSGAMDQFVGVIDENLDTRRGQPHMAWARLCRLARYGFVQKERCSIQVKPRDPTEVPQLRSAERSCVPVNRRCSVGNDQHDRMDGRATAQSRTS